MKKTWALRASFIFMLALIALSLVACGDDGKELSQPRGRYIYDEADRLPIQSEISLASYLWRLDSQSGYEIVLMFPKEQMDEQNIIDWFNNHGVGKKNIDNGTAVFILPDSSIFVAIGSGNDKISVTYSKTYGERIFQDFKNDPVLTLLRFTSAIGGKINEGVGREIGSRVFDGIKNNFDIILFWVAAIALLLFLIQQFNGFQPSDFILPIAVFVILGLFLGISALSSGISNDSYQSYGIITSTQKDSYVWIETRVITTTDANGNTTTTVVTIPHTRYTNDVKILSYELNEYRYQFWADDSSWPWKRDVGETDMLTLGIKNEKLYGVSVINDKSGGKTIGDGVWILAGKNKK